MVDSSQVRNALPETATTVPGPSLPAAMLSPVPSSDQATEASSGSSASLIQSLLQLSSQQVQHIHTSISPIPPQTADDEASATIWQTAESAAVRQRAEQRAREQPTAASVSSASSASSAESASLLSPDAFSSASFTYSQLCHDMPMLTVDGLTALTSGLQLHIAQQTLPASFFSLNLPFLYQLLQQCAHITPSSPSSSSDLSAAVSSLYSVLLFSLFPLLLVSPLSSLRSFLSPLPASLSSCIQSLHSLQQRQLHAVPAFYVSSDELQPQHDGEEEKTLDDEDDASFVFEADALSDEDEEQQQQQHGATATSSTEDEAAGWQEAEGRLCQLLELWSSSWLLSAEQSRLPAVLLQLQSVASQHQRMFVAGSPSSALLRHHVGRLLSSLLVTSPSLLPSCLPDLLSSVLGVTSISIDAFQPSQPVSAEREEEERTALLLLSRLCSTPSPPSVSSFLFRLLDRNLLWLSSFSSLLVSAPAVASSRWHRSVDAVVAVASFYIFQHPGNRSGREDGGRELIVCGLLSDLLSLQPVLAASSSSPPLFAFLCSASALSPAVASVLRKDAAYRSWMQTSAMGKELLLSPVLLSLQLHSGREEATVEVRRKSRSWEQKQGEGSTVPASAANAGKKGKKKLLVAALVDEEEGKAEAEAGSIQDSELLSLLQRSEEQMRAAVHSAFPSASSAASAGSLLLINDVVGQLSLLSSSSPAFAAILRPYLQAPPSPAVSAAEERKDGQDTQAPLRRWGELLREVSTQCAMRLKQAGRRDDGQAVEDNSSSSSVDAESDSERRQRAKTRQARRYAAEQQTAVMQTLLLSCKGLFGDGSKKD